jgi:hypothetical protein
MLRRRQQERHIGYCRWASAPRNTAIPSPALTTASNRRSYNSNPNALVYLLVLDSA